MRFGIAMLAGFACGLTGTTVAFQSLTGSTNAGADEAVAALFFAPVLGAGPAFAGFFGALVTTTFLDHRRVVGAAVAGTVSLAVVVWIHLAILF